MAARPTMAQYRVRVAASKDAPNLMAHGWRIWKSNAEVHVRGPAGLEARGIQLPKDFDDPSIVELELGPEQEPAQPHMLTKFRNGILETVTVGSETQLSFTAQGRVYSLPARRTRVTALWGLPLRMDRFNAING